MKSLSVLRLMLLHVCCCPDKKKYAILKNAVKTKIATIAYVFITLFPSQIMTIGYTIHLIQSVCNLQTRNKFLKSRAENKIDFSMNHTRTRKVTESHFNHFNINMLFCNHLQIAGTQIRFPLFACIFKLFRIIFAFDDSGYWIPYLQTYLTKIMIGTCYICDLRS